jgi:hypothetical protein
MLRRPSAISSRASAFAFLPRPTFTPGVDPRFGLAADLSNWANWFEFAERCAHLPGFSGGDATLYHSKANTRTAHKSLIPSVLAFYGRSVKDKWS